MLARAGDGWKLFDWSSEDGNTTSLSFIDIKPNVNDRRLGQVLPGNRKVCCFVSLNSFLPTPSPMSSLGLSS